MFFCHFIVSWAPKFFKVYTKSFILNLKVPFYLWRINPTLRLWTVPKYHEDGCFHLLIHSLHFRSWFKFFNIAFFWVENLNLNQKNLSPKKKKSWMLANVFCFCFKSNIMIDVYRKRMNVDFLRNSYFKFSLILEKAFQVMKNL